MAEDLLELAVDRIPGFGQDAHQHFARQIAEARDDRQPSREFRDQAEHEEVGRLHARVEAIEDPLVVGIVGGDEPEAVRLRHDVVEADKRAAADEQDVGRINVLRVLQLDLRTFHDLQERVLDTFAGDRARLLACFELVDLVDEDDAVLSLVDVAASLVDETLEDGLDLVVDVTGLGERSRLRRDERHAEDARQRLAHQRLAGARRADHEHIALGDGHAVLRRLRYLAEMGVDGDGNDLLGIILADDVAVKRLDDSAWSQFRVEHGSLGFGTFRHLTARPAARRWHPRCRLRVTRRRRIQTLSFPPRMPRDNRRRQGALSAPPSPARSP